jgi:glutamate decarboxylase
MVHLSSIPKDNDLGSKLPEVVKRRATLQLCNDDDQFTTSVYGSKFAAEDLPRHEMPEGEMPRDVAYRMIKDELSLDGNPMLK